MISGAHFSRAILLARYLGIEEFGRFSLAWMAVLFASSLHAAVILMPMMSLGPKQSSAEVRYYYGVLCVHQLFFAILTFISIMGGGLLLTEFAPSWNIGEFLLACAFAASAFITQDFMRRYFFTLGNVRTAFVNDMICYVGQLLVLILLFRVTTLSSVDALWILGATSALAAGIGALTMGQLAWRISTFHRVTRLHWNFSKWLLLSALLHWTSGNIFILAAGAMLGAGPVGALKAAQTIMGVLRVFFNGLGNAVLPRAAWHMQSGGLAALRAYLRQITWLVVAATTIVTCAAAAAPEFWLRLAFGEAYFGYGFILQWYALISLVACMDLIFRTALQTLEHTRPILMAHLATTFFSVIAAYPLIAWQGLTGVMIGIFISQCIMQLKLFHESLAPLNVK
ncbi:MAG: polysaccharide biosynthesis C-terminal domain-containing protein [Gammaproteobacteria bacterium]|nr:polysaccharide biosynthesis C-terminal domain-containing protein [Gammaproteobacteria bacterium]